MFAKVHPAEDVKSGNTGSCHDLVRYLEKETGEGSFLAFIVSLVAGAFASVVLRIVFINLSMQRKFGKFKRQVFVISNKDLLNSL